MSDVSQPQRPASASPSKTEIRALTGVRIIAALWVVLFHIRGNIGSESQTLGYWVGPLIAHGELGVDLFFSLSGFVLTLNYVDKMGLTFERRKAATFLWARIARVWPVFFLTLLVSGLWHGVLMATNGGDPVPVRDFGVVSFFRQALLVALWTDPSHDRLMWNGPSWSVSAEAFAYALFPLLVLLLFRLGKGLSARRLIVLSVVAVLPVTLFVGAYASIYVPWAWMLRIVCEFFAGALMYLAVRQINQTDRVRKLASIGAVVLVVLVVAWLYFEEWTGRGGRAPMIAPAFVLLVGLLAVGDRYLSKLLATKIFVVGGAASYSVYMVHMLVVEPFWWLQGHSVFFAPGSLPSKIGFLLIPFIVVAIGYAVWRWFEEPARKAMRGMSTASRSDIALGPIVADPLEAERPKTEA
jgi:peptidoglycan/LPS O-acetylase OafA/YrhL